MCLTRQPNETRNRGNITCFSDTVNNNEADKNNGSDHTEVPTNDYITSVKPLFDNVFNNGGKEQLSANSDDSWGKNEVEISKTTVNRLIFSH